VKGAIEVHLIDLSEHCIPAKVEPGWYLNFGVMLLHVSFGLVMLGCAQSWVSALPFLAGAAFER
jgi:hypothetical protein